MPSVDHTILRDAITPEGVLLHTPADVRDAGVLAPGSTRGPGIPHHIYERIVERVALELTYRVTALEVPDSLLNHPLLVQVGELFTAARCLRTTRTYEEVVALLFAEANLLLTQFYETVAKVSETGTGAMILTIDETDAGGEAAATPWLPNPNIMSDGWHEVKPASTRHKPKP